jgi:hypothetical protein
MDYGNDSYTTPTAVQTYLDRTLDANELAILAYVIPAASRWIDRTLGSNFDNLPTNVPFDPTNPTNPLCGWQQKRFAGGHQEINIKPCQQILYVQSINPYDFSVWYTYSTPLEYTAEPYDFTVKRSLRMKANEFTGNNLMWPGDVDGVQVTALFTEYDYVHGTYPNDIILLCNHISAVWLQNNQNAEPVQRESLEGHMVIKRIDDLLASDPMVTRVIESRQEVWLDEM